MNVRRFTARTTREAMAQVRAELGPDAIVLKNRAVPGGVEIVAMADVPAEPPVEPLGDAMPAAFDDEPSRPAATARPRDESMSTLTFQQYVRERLARRQAEEAGQAPARAENAPVPAPVRSAREPMVRVPGPELRQPASPRGAEARVARDPFASQAAQVNAPFPGGAVPSPSAAAPRGGAPMPGLSEMLTTPAPATEAELMAELRAMRGLISSQLSSLAWFDGVRRNPLQVQLLRRMVGAGFSAGLARKLVARLPSDYGDGDAQRWMQLTLAGLIGCDTPGDSIVDRGGIYALVGPTGVGKTTTAAKLAAQFALRHGVQSVGLITVDAYRIGGQDQLRTFGRLLGVPVHVAYDAGTLAEFLHLFMNKKLVIVDTVGIGQRDERLGELLSSLSSARLRKLLVLNAAAQAETLEDVITAYRGRECAGVVLSKLDEAVKTGGVLDCVARHRLRVVGVADGQRVPEDWRLPDAGELISGALAERRGGAFDLDDSELTLLFGGNEGGAGERAHV